jgi:hypothetical protein
VIRPDIDATTAARTKMAYPDTGLNGKALIEEPWSGADRRLAGR